MATDRFERISQPGTAGLGDVMRTTDEVSAIVELHRRGWGTKRIAEAVGCSRNPVKRYLRVQGWSRYPARRRLGILAMHADFVAERFRQHAGNCDVVRQDLEKEKGLIVSLRTVERAAVHLRREFRAEVLATPRFETAPGYQLQIDFGTRQIEIGAERVRVSLFVATLGYSRRIYARAFAHERQSSWFEGLEGAFRHFGGLPEEVLFDNAPPLVTHHDAATREVRFNERLEAFARYWGFRPRACGPGRARTKGKDERGVGYVKHNAIAGHRFSSWAALEGHLDWWMREIADQRVHDTTGEVPLERFVRDEARALRPLDGRPPFGQIRDLQRVVRSDCTIELDTNAYSVPWQMIGESVQVVSSGDQVSIRHAGKEVAVHAKSAGRHQRVINPAHFVITGQKRDQVRPALPAAEPALLRPLAEYEQLVGGGW